MLFGRVVAELPGGDHRHAAEHYEDQEEPGGQRRDRDQPLPGIGERHMLRFQYRQDVEIAVDPETHDDQSGKHQHGRPGALHPGRDTAQQGSEEHAADHDPEKWLVVPVHLQRNHAVLVIQVAEPGHEELGPEHVEPQQAEGRDQDAHLLETACVEPLLKALATPQHRAHQQDRRRPGQVDALDVVEGINAAVVVRDQRHPEVPGDEGVRHHIEEEDEEGREIQAPLQLEQAYPPAPRRQPPPAGAAHGIAAFGQFVADVRQQAPEEIQHGQHVEGRQRNKVAPQQQVLVQPRTQLSVVAFLQPVEQGLTPAGEDQGEADKGERQEGQRHHFAEAVEDSRKFRLAQAHDRGKTDARLAQSQHEHPHDQRESPGKIAVGAVHPEKREGNGRDAREKTDRGHERLRAQRTRAAVDAHSAAVSPPDSASAAATFAASSSRPVRRYCTIRQRSSCDIANR